MRNLFNVFKYIFYCLQLEEFGVDTGSSGTKLRAGQEGLPRLLWGRHRRTSCGLYACKQASPNHCPWDEQMTLTMLWIFVLFSNLCIQFNNQLYIYVYIFLSLTNLCISSGRALLKQFFTNEYVWTSLKSFIKICRSQRVHECCWVLCDILVFLLT